MIDINDEITLELARLQRAAIERARRRNAEQQLGKAWVGLETKTVERRMPLD